MTDLYGTDLSGEMGFRRGRQVAEAVYRNRALSREGFSERLFALLFSGLVYPQIWEDPEIDMEAMRLGGSHRVVTIASGAAFDGQVGQTAYASSKAGLVGLCLPAARELAGIGIRINTIAPGAFWTPMLESLPETVLERIQADFQFPRRFGRAEEIAALCCHIAENHFINGECIRLDGAFRLPPR